MARTEPLDPLDDPHAPLPAAVQWLFGPDTGSRYRLYRAKAIKFNPLTDVKTFEDLLDDPVSEPMMAHPSALQLRNLQTLVELGVEKNTIVVFPAPLMSCHDR
jgi:hypothetical protein